MNTRFNKRIYNLVEKVLSETDANILQPGNRSVNFPGHNERMAGHGDRVEAHYRKVMDNPEDFSEEEVTHAQSFFRGKNKASGRRGGRAPKTRGGRAHKTRGGRAPRAQ